ncbi:MAG: GntR family transcriptional regulator [Roseitalea sp.]|nr:GntR family transcriptional regulator [Roseitalea sp.]MBO6953823.1 GntR family transcriptional regulator [Rhizobiaceae bacterium]MCR9196979.1 GntR family transcriptional regulator [Hyphomonas sp.]MBO6594156.1 GntR family transcriptional regulator [Roseitalea sp.]MBO6601530.1 GntR family transcriptional regulator [Roseitalea sp.]
MSRADARSEELSDQILEFIRSSDLRSGDRLPSEGEMADQLGISRAKVREVYVSLLERGVIERQHGKGTFVKEVPIKDDQGYQSGFAASIAAAGLQPTVEILAVAHSPVDVDLASELRIAPGTEVPKLLRLFRADGDPVVLIEDYLAPRFDVEAMELDQNAIDLIAAMSKQADLSGSWIDTHITATNLSHQRAQQFDLPAGSPAIHIHSLVRSSRDEILCAARAWLNPSQIKLKSSRRVNMSDPAMLSFIDRRSAVSRRTSQGPFSKQAKGNPQ